MTDPAPSVQPVRAWAVVDKDSKFDPIMDITVAPEKWAVGLEERYNLVFPARAPHRVIRVEIREVNDE